MQTPGQIPSHPVTSDQNGPHLELFALLDRHLQHPWRRPYAAHTVTAWLRALSWLTSRGVMPGPATPLGISTPLILDSGCGVAESSLRLAMANPQAAILAVDQSADRLSRAGAHARMLGLTGVPENLLLVRADLGDFWRQLFDAGYRPREHWLLYPNPWPKAHHLGRRWHGHPAFPYLLALGGQLELRTNWRLYAEEFSLAVQHSCAATAPVELHESDQAMTPFERKYTQSKQPLWRVRLQVDSLALSARWVAQPTANTAPPSTQGTL